MKNLGTSWHFGFEFVLSNPPPPVSPKDTASFAKLMQTEIKLLGEFVSLSKSKTVSVQEINKDV